VVGVLSPFLTVEEAYCWPSISRAVEDVRLALGPVPKIGEDDTYPKDRKGGGRAVKFTIRAEKCPNAGSSRKC